MAGFICVDIVWVWKPRITR